MKWMNESYLGNTVQTWLIALGVAVGVYLVLYLIERLAVRRVRTLAVQTKTRWDDIAIHAIEQTKPLFVLIVAVYAGTRVPELPDPVPSIVKNTALIALWVQVGIWGGSAVKFWVEDQRKRQLEKDPASVTTMNAIGYVARLVLWAVVVLLVLDNLGIDVTALVAGLGIGGIAIALAVQNILGDLFASLSIVLDKPFVYGDFISVGDLLGTVEKVGIKTTRVRSLSGEQLVFSNADLLTSRIRNYGRLYERRIVFTIGVTYQTPKEKLEKIPAFIREAVEHQDKTRFDRSHFASYGDFSLNFETVYFVLVPEYGVYMDVQQGINLELYERFANEGIEFAYPTQTLFIEKETA